MKLLLSLFSMILITCAAWAQTNYDTVRIRPIKVSEQIYMLKGAGGNIGLLVGKEGSLLVDINLLRSPTKSTEPQRPLIRVISGL